MANEAQLYNDPAGGTDSSIGVQFRTDHYHKKALIEAAKEQYFGQLANVRAMPKNMGKTIKQYHYMPLLDDRNLNDQGIDAAGNIDKANGAAAQATIIATDPGGMDWYFVASDANAIFATAQTNAQTAAEAKVASFLLIQGYNTINDTFAELSAAAIVDGWAFAAVDIRSDAGNLYGSSKDVGTILGKLPVLSETGGRKNRVGHKRIELNGTISKFGFFDEYTQESVDFDTDSELQSHIVSESVKAANEMTEDQLQIDLLANAGVVRFTGAAANTASLTGGLTPAAGDAVEYDDLVKLGIELDNNRTPKQTTITYWFSNGGYQSR